jgi:hypothetical protein
VDSGFQSPSDVLSISSGSNYDAFQSTYDPQVLVISEPQHMNHCVILHPEANTKESVTVLSAKKRNEAAMYKTDYS